MEYTLEQKALAAIRGDLWWRLPDGDGESARAWSLVHDDVVGVELNDLQRPGFVYYIGPKTPPILSELEAELLATLVDVDGYLSRECFQNVWTPRQLIQAAIKKARGKA